MDERLELERYGNEENVERIGEDFKGKTELPESDGNDLKEEQVQVDAEVSFKEVAEDDDERLGGETEVQETRQPVQNGGRRTEVDEEGLVERAETREQGIDVR